MHLHWLKAFSSPSLSEEPSTQASINSISSSRVHALVADPLAALSELEFFEVGALLLHAVKVTNSTAIKSLYIIVGLSRMSQPVNCNYSTSKSLTSIYSLMSYQHFLILALFLLRTELEKLRSNNPC
jgi:hypothetical protein